MKYARLERERRFLLERLPIDLPEAYTRIIDKYISGTRLRLRCMENSSGQVIDRKFGQKYIPDNSHPGHMVMTNLYLDAAEYAVLAALPGRELVKRRYHYPYGNVTFSIDVLEGDLDGIILAEIEFMDDKSFNNFLLPTFAVREVTDDMRFSGGVLVHQNAKK